MDAEKALKLDKALTELYEARQKVEAIENRLNRLFTVYESIGSAAKEDPDVVAVHGEFLTFGDKALPVKISEIQSGSELAQLIADRDSAAEQAGLLMDSVKKRFRVSSIDCR